MQNFLEGLKVTDPDDFAAVIAGLAKFRNRQYHREPLSKALGNGLFEMRHVGKLNTRIILVFDEKPADRGAAWAHRRGIRGHPIIFLSSFNFVIHRAC